MKWGECSLAAFLSRQPSAELICVLPTHTDDRMLRRLSEPGIFPAHSIQLESICDYGRGHASDGIIAGCFDKGIEISKTCLPDRDMDLSEWDETHFERVRP